jgi:hypothetical protein
MWERTDKAEILRQAAQLQATGKKDETEIKRMF